MITDVTQLKKLPPRQRLAIELLAGGAAASKAAASAGVSRVTLSRWMRDDCFRLAVEDRSGALTEELGKRVTSLAGQALDILEEVLGDPGARREVRVRAAAIIMQNYAKLKEITELSARVDRLEDRSWRA